MSPRACGTYPAGCGGRCGDRGKGGDDGGPRRLGGDEAQGRPGDDAQGALGADEQLEQRQSGDVLDPFAAEGDQGAVGEHDVEAEHVVGGDAVLHAAQAAGVGREVAADRADLVRRRVGRVPEPVLGRRPLDLHVERARLDHRADAAPAAAGPAPECRVRPAPEPAVPEVARSPCAPITATTLLTGTVSPSCTRISSSTPAPGDGISASTLSVEISKSGSSRSTASTSEPPPSGAFGTFRAARRHLYGRRSPVVHLRPQDRSTRLPTVTDVSTSLTSWRTRVNITGKARIAAVADRA